MHEQKVSEIIAQLKEIKKTKGYTYQSIYEMIEESGGLVSMATIKRVFAEGSEEKNFRYEDSIKPIVIALVGKEQKEPEEGQTISIAEQEANTLRAVAALKDDMIKELQGENKRLQKDAERKDKHIAALTEQVNRKDRAIFWLVFTVIALAALIIAALIIDRINPNLGYFWRSVSAVVTGNSPMKSAGSSDNIGTVLKCIIRR